MFNLDQLKMIGKQAIAIIVAAIVVLLLLKFLFSTKYFPKNPNNALIERKIDSLYRQQDSLNKILLNVRKSQEQLVQKGEENNKLIENNNRELQILKNKYNEKINGVNNYSPTQLDSFFTDRYGKYN